MEISVEIFKHITWIVKDFLELAQERGSFLDSPEFTFSADRYCLRLFPKGESTDENLTVYHVRRLSVTCPERKVSCEVGIRKREPNGDECYLYSSKSLEEDCSHPRSWIERYRDACVPDGSLTVVCCMRLREESRAGSSAQGEEERGGFPGYSASFSSRWCSPKVELMTEFPCTRVALTVPRYFDLPRETGDSLTSPEFRFAGDTYCFRFRPNGVTGDIDLELNRLTSAFAENTVFYRVGYGWPNKRTAYPNNSRPLVGNKGFCLSRSKLEEERYNYVPDGTLSLCLFLYLGERSRAGAGTSDVARERRGFTGIHKLQSDFRQVLQKGAFSDACIVVRGKQFRVHRLVLCARSTVFEAMLNHDTVEKESGRVIVDDLDPDSFEVFLEYLYAGDVQAGLSDDNVFGLYAAADKYDVHTLKSECVAYMRRTLSVESFCDVITLALRHGEEDLLQQSIHFLRDNFQRIIITDKWKQFIVDNAATANELLIEALVPS